ncbi:folate/biopterin family MFS transporter [Chryseobacterium sp. NEB161]|nr:folate/biopterin family MFS transporter [Chryseobacterium sp. NEB161]
MNETLNYVLVIYLWVAIGTQIGFIFYYYIKFFYEFLGGNKISWNSKYDRLLLTGSIFFLLLSIFLYSHLLDNNSYYNAALYIIVITLLSLLTVIMLKNGIKESKNNDLAKSEIVNKTIQEKEYSFKLNYSKIELMQIYHKMVDNSFIEILIKNPHMNDNDYFVDILFNGKLPEQTFFKLNFDNIQTKTFWDHLKSREIGLKQEKKMSREKFAKIFENNNGKIKVNSLSASKSKATSEAKKIEIINSLFDFIKKG